MALADIISRVRSDAESEAAAIIERAETQAAIIRAEAAEKAEAFHAETIAVAQRDGEREASRIVVNARLMGRDDGLADRRGLIEAALEQTTLALTTLPDAEYATFLAKRIAATARGGERMRLGSAESGRGAVLAEALRLVAPGLELSVDDEPAPFERGVLIEGDRVRADLSLASIVEERRDELELVVADRLFGEGA